MPNDVIITPGSGRIQFVKDVGQELTRFNIDLSPTNGLILDTALTCSVGIKAPNMLDSFGNNTFAGTSTFNGPTVINGDLSVFGATNIFSASNVYITSSNLTVTDNILTLNALTPYQRYAGIEMFDSGSNTKSQFLWDGQGDYFFISGSGVNGKIITGPDGQSDLTSGYVPKATAGYKLGNSVMYDDGTRVGIGTTAPSGSLTIQSNGTQLRLQTASGPSSYYATIDALYNSTHPFQIAVAGNSVNTAEYFGIYADAGGSNPRIALLNGNVGVGLTNPSAKFHVTSSTNADEVLIGTIGDNQIIGGRTGGSFGIATKSTSNGNLILTSGNELYIRTSGSNDRVIVKNDGKVGIGTTNPATYTSQVAIETSLNRGLMIFNPALVDTGTLFGLGFGYAMSNYNSAYIGFYKAGNNNTSNRLFFSLWNQDNILNLTGLGYVGIGTTSPTTKFHVSGSHVNNNGMSRFESADFSIISLKAPSNGNGSNGYWGFRVQDKSDNDLMFYGYVYTSAFSGFRIDPSFAGSIPRGFFVRNSDGSVGVGTNVPNAKLNVNSSGSLASGSVVFRVEGTQGSLFSVDDSLSGSLMSVNDISGLPILEVFSDDRVVAGTFNSNTFVVTGSRVGIGTNIPTAKLQVGTNSISGTSNNSGNVRIGQSNAAGAIYGLALANTATATVGNESALSFIVASDYSATGIISTVLRNTSTAASDLVFTNYNNGLNERMRIQYDGNVGIGSTNPQYKLDVNGVIGISGRPFANSSGNYTALYEPAGNYAIYLGNATDPNNYYDNTGHYFRNRGGSSIYAYINSSGNLGIGTTTITARVHIKGGNEHIEGTVSGSAVIDSGLYAMQIGPAQVRTTSAGTYYPGIAFNHLLNFSSTTYNGAPQAWIGTRLQDSAGSERDYLVFATKPGTGTSGTGNDIPLERMCIDYAGNVGIGTTSPNTKFEVAGYAMAGSGTYRTSIYGDNGGAYIYFGTPSSVSALGTIGAYGALFNINSLNNDISFQYNSAEKMRITTGGHLGLGITTPTSYVNANATYFRPSTDGLYSSVFATTEAVINLISSGSADGAAVGGVYFTRARAQGDAHFQIAAIRAIQSGTSNTIAGGALQFFTKGNGGGTTATTPQMVIWNDGNVGIGTANPTRPLHVYSSNNAPIWIQGTTGGAWLDFQSSTSNLLSIGADGTNGIGFYNRTNSTYLAVINNTGNLGVGTSSPGATLDLWAAAARIKFRRTSSYDMSFGIHDSSTSALSIKNSGDASTIAYFQYDGNVGIGTTSFAYASSNRGNVEIYGSTDALIGLRNSTANSYLQKLGNDFYFNNGGAGIIYFANNGANRMIIDSGGNVGIGTTTIAAPLTVKRSSGEIARFGSPNGSNSYIMVGRDDANTLEGFVFGYNSSNGDCTIASVNASHPIIIKRGGVGGTESMRVDGSGNVGIGTTVPNSKLNVIAGNTPGVSIQSNNSGQYAYLYVGRTANDLSVGVSGGTDQFFVGTVAGDAIIKKESGNRLMLGVGSGAPTITINSSNFLGLGTTTPSASLHVNSTTAGATLIRADGTNGTLFSVVDDLSDSLMSVNNSAGLPVFEVFADDRIVVGQYGQNDLVVVNNKVGIGTNNPTAKLYVTSSISTPSAVFLGGSVGIGTSSPAYKLDISGSFGINASASDTNWAFVVSDNSSAGSRYSLNKLGSMGFNYADTYAQLQLLGAAGAYLDFSSVAGGDSNARLIYYANDRIDLTYGFTTTLTLRSSNAGIGTTAPRSGFQINTINGSSANEYAGLTVSATVSASRGVNIAYDATNDIGVIQPVHNGVTWKNLSLVPQGGGVGIGNTSPSYKLHVSGDIYANGGWFRVSGTQGYYFETYGGGWFMNDNTWIRSYNSKNIWSGTGLIGSDGGLTVGYNGASPTSLGAIISGSVGIGTSSPSYKLHVVGTGYYSSTLQVNSNITLSGGGDVIINDSDGTGAFNSFMDSGVGYIRIDDGGSANGSLNINSGLLFVSGSSSAVGVNTSNFSYASNDNSRFVGSNTNNKLFVNGSIQLLNDNDAIVIGRGTATFLTDEELGFGWGGGWYMTDTTYLRVRNNKVLYNNGEIWGTVFKDSSNTAYYLDPASTSVLYSIAAGVAGNSSANIPALKVTSAGTATTQAAIAIQQQTSEGDTIIFCDYAQYVEYNFMHENATNQFIIHGGSSTGNLGSNTFYSPDGTAKTGYIKHVFETDNGNSYHGGNIGIGTNVTNARVESYYSSNAITFNYLATNLNVNSPIPVYGFDVTSGAESRSIKAGIGYERHLSNGRGTLHFYNDSTNDTQSLAGNRTTAGDIKMSLDNSGNLGIGTTQPSWLLTVYAASAPQFTLQNGTRSFILTNNSGDNLLSFNYGGVNRLQFDTTNQWFNTGNLGVGNTSPQYKLHVTQATPSGAIAAPANTSIQVDSNTNNYISFVNSSDNGTYAGLTFVDNNIGGYIVFRNYTGDVLNGSDSLIYGTYQDHIFQTGTSAGVNSRNEVMRIKNGGNVGIGSNNPQYKLDVNGAANLNGALTFGTVAVLNTSNNANDIYANIRVIRNVSSTLQDGMYINYDSAGTTAAHLRFYANGSNERMRIQANDGNVGIGTTSAGRRLDVEGIVRTRGASGTGGFEIGAASTGAARWRIEWDSASDSLDFNWVA